MKTPSCLFFITLSFFAPIPVFGADSPVPAGATAPVIASAASADAVPDRSMPLVLNVWPGGLFPGDPGNGQPERRINNEQYENVSVPTLTVYWPAPDKALGVAMIVSPGGGYTSVWANKEGEQPAKWLAERGFTAILLKYRVPNGQPRYLKGMQDLQRAVSLVRSKAKAWDIDPNRIGVIGFSAGGQMMADVATNFNTLSYPEVDEVDKVSSRPDFVVMAYPGGIANRGATEITASEVKITNQTPPTFITIGYSDSNGSENGAILYLALLHAGVPAELHIYQDVGHGFGLVAGSNPHNTWQDRMMDWLKYNKFLQRTDVANPAGPAVPARPVPPLAAPGSGGRGGRGAGGRRGAAAGAAAPEGSAAVPTQTPSPVVAPAAP
jgi:acetyl esterase/lipase